MRFLRLILRLIAMVLVAIECPAASQAAPALLVFGSGSDTCVQWIEARRLKKDFVVNSSWLRNHGLSPFGPRVIFESFDEYCRTNPASALDEAATKIGERLNAN